ncbi:NFACT RNA binding domain-containing protein [Nanoarchaeota archaeon]
MEIEIDLKKSVQKNASDYFEKAKKAKKKVEGAKEAITMAKKKLEQLKKKAEKTEQKELEKQKAQKIKKQKKPEWYEKFRWFISSEGFLIIGGRDATTNEIVIKKHTDKEDYVSHTEISGSPFFVIKTKIDGKTKTPGKETLQETADATCSFSSAWKLGLTSTDTFWVMPEQVSKQTEAGEYMGKGSFMVRGKRNYVVGRINMAVGKTDDDKVMCGPVEAIKKNCSTFFVIIQGKEKASDIAKQTKTELDADPDDIIRVLPSGGMKITKN